VLGNERGQKMTVVLNRATALAEVHKGDVTEKKDEAEQVG